VRIGCVMDGCDMCIYVTLPSTFVFTVYEYSQYEYIYIYIIMYVVMLVAYDYY
jgi:hypothetical protein